MCPKNGSHGSFAPQLDGICESIGLKSGAGGTGSSYQGNAEFSGTDTLVMETTDPGDLSASSAVNIEVTPDNRLLTVTGSTVNEASPYVLFQVTGAVGQKVTLALGTTGAGSGHATLGTDALTNLEYFNGTAWASYTGLPVTIPAGGTLLVRSAVLQDSSYEGTETLQLTATNKAGTGTSGTSSIVDNGSGSIFTPTNGTFVPNVLGDPGYPTYLDDDRSVTVNNVSVNEGSPYAVFTVTGYTGQVLRLDLNEGTATNPDFGPALEIYNGTAWVAYTAGTDLTMTGTTLLVRTPITNDGTFEGQEAFYLGVERASSDTSVYGTGNIYDDGTGSIFLGNNTTGTPNTGGDPGYPASLDDDRTLSVGNVTVNEASDYAIFTLSGNSGQTVTLNLIEESANGTVSGKAFIDTSIASLPNLEIYAGNDTNGDPIWETYDPNAAQPTFNADGKIFVRVNIEKEQDTPYEGGETFRLEATLTGQTSAASGTATIQDDGTGVIHTGNISSGTPATSTSGLDDDRTVSVNSISVNEGSPYGVFTVTGYAGQVIRLALSDGTAGALDYGPAIEIYNGTNWVSYTPGTDYTLTGSTLLVRTAIQQDSTHEGSETFTLGVTNMSSGTVANGTGTITDDGTGSVFLGNTTTGTPNTAGDPGYPSYLDDDRTVSVNDISVNEGSPYGVFTVSANTGQIIRLSLSDGTAGVLDYGPSLEIYNGTNWVAYTAGSDHTMTGSTLLVRTTITNDNPYEGPETFTLGVTRASAGTGATGTATIYDDGTGSIYLGNGTTGTPNTPGDPGYPTQLDDDRNSPPVANDDSFTANENDAAAVIGNAINDAPGNDTDPDSDPLTTTVDSGNGSAGGIFSIAANGNVTFNPNGQFEDLAAGETRQTSFTYTLVDDNGATDTATVTVTVTGENDTPITVGTLSNQLNNDSDAITPLDVSGFFGDPDSTDVLTYSDGGTLPPGLTIDPNTGIISGTLDSSASAGGPYTVVITAEDPSGATVTQTFTWTVNNPAPIAQDDDFTADEDDGSVVVGNAILNNDSDPDGDVLTAQIQSGVSGTQGGLFSIASNGEVTFDTNGDFEDLAAGETRTTSFTYTLEDADGATSTATVTVTVTGENDTPITVGTIAAQTNNDSDPVTLNVSGAFGDPDSTDVLTYSDGGTLPPGLTIDLNTGIISGTLDASASASGPYTVVITAEDPSGAMVTQSFTWTVNNPGPIAQDDDFAADEDDGSAVVGNAILNNDSDPDGDVLTAQVQAGVAGTQGGLFSIAANGDVTFDPNGEFEDLALGETRTTSFTYTLEDADGATSTAIVTVTVTGENDTPITVGTIAAQTNDDSDAITLNVSGAFGDPDSTDVLTYSDGGTLPPGLTIDLNTGIISGTLDSSASASGPYTVVITAEDPSGATVTQTFTWTVNNPAPIAQGDDFAADEDDGSAVVGNAILNNDSDPDGDALTAQVQSGVVGTQGGLFSIAANGEVTFDTNGDFEDLAVGETRTTSFTYTLEDADGATSTAIVTVTVTGENDTPITVGTISTQTNNDSDAITPLDVSGFFGDPDSTDVLTYSDGGTLPPGLTIDLNTGIISGTLDSSASASGPYTVVITAEDPSGATVTQSFTWTVNNPAPIAQDDDFTADEDDGSAVVGNAILNNDSDPDGDALTAQVQSGVVGTQGGLFSIAANGEVTFDTNGDFEDLAVGETRTTSFTYTLEDADGATSTAIVTVTVTGENDTPVTIGTIATQNNNDSDVISLGAANYFSDPDTSDVLSYSATDLPGGLTIDPVTGEITGTIASSASVAGSYLVEVTAADGNGGTVSLSFTWNVANPAPIAVDDDFVADEDDGALVMGNVITGSDSDPDGDSLAVQVVDLVPGNEGGLFSIAANGDVTFDPNGEFEDLAAGETRATSITYTLVDADGATSTATVTITVNGANDAPMTVGTVATQSSIDGETIAAIDLSVHFADVDNGSVLSYTATGLPTGLVIDSVTGIISGTIDRSASQGGPFNVVVTAADGLGGSVTQSFVWTVTNPEPIANDDAFTAFEDDGLVMVGNAITNNDTDPDGDALTALVQDNVVGDNGGLFSIDAEGNVTFDPNGEFNDLLGGESRETSFTYTIEDADGARSTATVTVTVIGVNAPPVPVSGKITVNLGSSGGSLGLTAPTDPDGDPLTITVSKLPRKGVLRLPNGKPVKVGQVLTAKQLERLVFDAPAKYKGNKPVKFLYSVSDGQYVTTARVDITIVQGTTTVTCYGVTYSDGKYSNKHKKG